MKKIYLLTIAVLFFAATNAQTALRLGSPLIAGKKNANAESAGSLRKIEGGIKCIKQYVAGSTMNLDFTIRLTNTDYQYGDSVAITFPAGITPNTSASNTTVLAPDTTGTGCAPETLNGVTGQVISWGDNDNDCGGITSHGVAFKFTVNVTVAAGLKGAKLAKFFISGDPVPNPMDLLDSFNILPIDTTLIDMETAYVRFDSKSSCGNTLVPVIGSFVNNGTVAATKIPVSYSVELGPEVYDTIPGPIAPGATVDFKFSKPADFTAIGDYFVEVKSMYATDAIPGNNKKDNMFKNVIPFHYLSDSAYVNGFNKVADFSPLKLYKYSSSPVHWKVSIVAPHSKPACLILMDSAAVSACDAWFVFNCIDVTAGEKYKLSYWKKTDTGFNGGIGVYYSDKPSPDSKFVVQAMKPTTADSTWAKDSVEFTPTIGTFYLGFRAKGTNAGKGTQVSIDDIKIQKVMPTGIKVVNNDKVVVYPNPSNGLFTVDMGITARTVITVYNVLGEQVFAKEFSAQKNTIDLTGFKTGIYSMRVIANNSIFVKQLILTK